MNPIDDIVALALREDGYLVDVTTKSIIPPDAMCRARVISRQNLVLSGTSAMTKVYETIDPDVLLELYFDDGAAVDDGAVIADVSGRTSSILCGERTALNFLQQLSGVATLTRAFCERVLGSRAKIVDTRKTVPGLRMLQKQAVVHGGGANHRMSLSDGVLIKDNHIAAAGSIEKAVAKARRSVHHLLRIEVEVESLDQVDEALAAGADALLLDNMSVEMMTAAVEKVGGRVVLEASGNVSLENVAQVAATGVDLISVGQLTHSSPACDISMEITRL